MFEMGTLLYRQQSLIMNEQLRYDVAGQFLFEKHPVCGMMLQL